MTAMQANAAPGANGLLEPLAPFLQNDNVSEILINRASEVFVEECTSMKRYNLPLLRTAYLRQLFTLLANENKQVLTEASPLLSGNLSDGCRVQLVIPPVASQYTLSIRKFTLKSMTMDDFAVTGFFNGAVGLSLKVDEQIKDEHEVLLRELYQTKNWQAFLTVAIHAKKTIVISGATSSGKTTFLNACLHQIPLDERLITLEYTYEIKAPHQNIVRLKAVKQVGTQEAKLTMQDLVQASLRLRPDRIIMGEIRGKEIFDFVSACSTGHNGSLATIHADNPRMAFMRMAQLYKLNNVPGMKDEDIHQLLHEVIDVVVQLKKTAHGRQMTSVYYKGMNHE
ncbi:P-type DNA transfer ATPase VirB11 [Legionella impletisoli]|uniref:Type IV secretion system protein n=1 Tax=Legionella impletisoli TaxID=343510 RepID=A0A917JR64_9GAMM|nr:P-type DNA transfer ATPase VirB11 [Legionella impletisoli]GGI82548.1 P-type DNA transfer ATPase VirB11 [Legionella impletisoli]